MAESGYIKLFRQIEDWRFWDSPKHTQVWVHLLIKANWKETGYKYGQELKPGETVITLRSFAEECGISRSTLVRVLNDLQEAQQIDRSLRQGKTFIKVHNYAVFQQSESQAWDTDGTEMSQKRDKNEPAPLSINRRSKEVKNKRNNTREAQPPTLSEIKTFIEVEKLRTKPERFFEYYQERNWRGITDWKAKAREWDKTEVQRPQQKEIRKVPVPDYMDPEKVREREEQERELREWAERYREEQERDVGRIPD